MLVLCNFFKILMVSDKMIDKALELLQHYKHRPLEAFIIFTIYQNYTLALILKGICNHYFEKMKKCILLKSMLVFGSIALNILDSGHKSKCQ